MTLHIKKTHTPAQPVQAQAQGTKPSPYIHDNTSTDSWQTLPPSRDPSVHGRERTPAPKLPPRRPPQPRAKAFTHADFEQAWREATAAREAACSKQSQSYAPHSNRPIYLGDDMFMGAPHPVDRQALGEALDAIAMFFASLFHR